MGLFDARGNLIGPPLRFGPGRVVGANLAPQRGEYPDQLSRVFVPTLEARAIRFWEDFSEGIMRWSCAGFAAAVAAQFSGFNVSLALGAGIPAGAIFAIDEVENRTGITVRARLGSPGLIPSANEVCVYTDGRWAPGNAPPPGMLVQEGAAPAEPGQSFKELTGGILYHNVYVGQAGQTDLLVFVGTVVNTAVAVAMSGRVIFPR